MLKPFGFFGFSGIPFENTYSLEFDGVNEYLTTPAKVNLGVNSTISYWFKGGTNANNTLLGEDDNQYDYVVQLATGTGQVAFRVGTKYSTWVGVTELSDNAWHHYAFVRNSTSADLYVDGSLKTKTVVGVYDGTDTTFHVLGAQGNFALPIDGFIDEFSGWNSALSAANVTALYNSGSPTDLKDTLVSNPIVWWRNGDGTALFRNAEWDIPNEMASDYFSQYSMEFDGVDDSIEIGAASLGITGAISVSCWFKIPTTNTGGGGTNIQALVVEDETGGVNRNWNLLWRGTGYNVIYWSIYASDGNYYGNTSTGFTPNDGNWHHLLGTYDGTTTTNGIKLYIDGVLNHQATSGASGLRATSTVEPTIGSLTSAAGWFFQGNIDEVSVFDAVKVPSDVSTANRPIDLSSESNLVAWWRMGEGATWNGTNWLLPDATKSALFSQKSFVFDGVNEYVDCGAFSHLNSATALTISVWFKSSTYVSAGVLISLDKHVDIYQGSAAAVNTKGRFTYRLKGAYGNSFKTLGGVEVPPPGTGAGDLCDGNWHHLCFVWDNSTTTAIVYEDGVAVITDTSTTGTLNSATENLYIGEGLFAGAAHIDGNIDDVSIFSSAKSAVEVAAIYNSGVPTDLSAESGLVGYWIFDDATFSTNWTVPDNSTNSNTGTSANMDEVDLTLDTPTNLNSGVSASMDEADKVLDSPSNENGMTSVNMEEDSRTEDVPT